MAGRISKYLMLVEPPPSSAIASSLKSFTGRAATYRSPLGYFAADIIREGDNVSLTWRHLEDSLRNFCLLLLAFFWLGPLIFVVGCLTLNWWYATFGILDAVFMLFMSRLLAFFVRPPISRVLKWMDGLA